MLPESCDGHTQAGATTSSWAPVDLSKAIEAAEIRRKLLTTEQLRELAPAEPTRVQRIIDELDRHYLAHPGQWPADSDRHRRLAKR